MSFSKKVFFILFFLVFWGTPNSYSQTFSIQQYTTEDGLPGATSYSIIQDKNRMLWIATDGGICKFDGLDFEPLKDGNVQGEMIKIFYDSQDRLWMIDLALQASYLDDGKLFRLENVLSTYPVVNVFEDLNHNNWFLHPNNVSVLIESDSIEKKSKHQVFNEKSMTSLKHMLSIDQNHTVLISRLGVDHFKNYQRSFETFKGSVPDLDFPRHSIKYGDSVLVSNNNRVFSFSLNDHILKPSFTQVNHLFDVGINYLFFDSDQSLWVATRDGVIYLQKKMDGFAKPIHLLKNYATQSIFQDHESNFWVTTQQEGVFKLSSKDISLYSNEKYGDRVSVVHSFSENEIIVGYNNNGMVVLDEEFNENFEKKLSVNNEEIYDIHFDSIQNELYMVANFGVFKIENESFDILKLTDKRGYKTCAVNNKNELWLGAYSSVSIFQEGKRNKKILPKRTYAIKFDEKNQAWIGTVEGLFFCKDKDCQKIPIGESNIDIRDLQFDENGALWIATQANGSFLYKDGKVLQHFTTQNGLSSNTCHRILLDDNVVWVATNNGISKINTSDFSIDVIRKDDGLPSNEIKFLHLKNNKIYAATSKGLAAFEKDFKVYSSPPPLSFTNVQIENTDTTLLSKYEIPYHQNDIEIKFNGTTFKNSKEVIYQYKMSPINDDWISSNTNAVSFPALPYGKYNFFVRAKSLNSNWSEPKQISFVVKRATWQTWWFFGIVALVSFLAGAKFIQLIFEEMKQRNEIQQNLKESQLTALRAQMNPHFIFNALNSIQDFIIQEDKRSANRYLSKFSKLMRNILDASDKNKISLKKEINYLELYLSLEALRIDGEFEYHFVVEEKINVDNILIPSMLLQPYVENALKHGLMHRSSKKELFIRFFQKENYLLCEIEDNGIGREASMKINEQNGRVYQSKAMSLTQDRIDLLNSADTSKLGLEIEDLKNEDGIATGTKVMIRIF